LTLPASEEPVLSLASAEEGVAPAGAVALEGEREPEALQGVVHCTSLVAAAVAVMRPARRP
jgi:hypothetical protein